VDKIYEEDMKAWILIILITTSGGSSGRPISTIGTTVEIYGEEACENAAQAVEEKWGRRASTVCVGTSK
jgi:hypothetical protein